MVTSIHSRLIRPTVRVAVGFALSACSLGPPIDHEQQGTEPTGWRMSGGKPIRVARAFAERQLN